MKVTNYHNALFYGKINSSSSPAIQCRTKASSNLRHVTISVAVANQFFLANHSIQSLQLALCFPLCFVPTSLTLHSVTRNVHLSLFIQATCPARFHLRLSTLSSTSCFLTQSFLLLSCYTKHSSFRSSLSQ